jgi:hypothetical protein
MWVRSLLVSLRSRHGSENRVALVLSTTSPPPKLRFLIVPSMKSFYAAWIDRCRCTYSDLILQADARCVRKHRSRKLVVTWSSNGLYWIANGISESRASLGCFHVGGKSPQHHFSSYTLSSTAIHRIITSSKSLKKINRSIDRSLNRFINAHNCQRDGVVAGNCVVHISMRYSLNRKAINR